MAATWLAVLVTWALTTAPSASGSATPRPPDLPTVLKAEPALDWDAKFAGTNGWIGGDGVCSVILGPRRVLWLFDDTLWGSVQGGRRVNTVMVNNTIAVQQGGQAAPLRFIAGRGPDGKPAAVLTPVDGKGWFWTQSAMRVSTRLFLFLAQIERGQTPGPFGFKHIGQWLALVENPEEEPGTWRIKQHRLPFAQFAPGRERSWGSAVLADRGAVDIYGYDAHGKGIGKRQLTVARVAAKKLADFGAWRFRTATGWSAKPADAAPLAGGLATEFSVIRLPGGKEYVAVYTENGLGDRIVGRFARAPDGPWSEAVLLYRCPAMQQDKGVFSYAAKAHPWAATGRELLVSYCVNAWDFAWLFRDERVCRPKFVRIKLGE
jgi:hypothetical protein